MPGKACLARTHRWEGTASLERGLMAHTAEEQLGITGKARPKEKRLVSWPKSYVSTTPAHWTSPVLSWRFSFCPVDFSALPHCKFCHHSWNICLSSNLEGISAAWISLPHSEVYSLFLLFPGGGCPPPWSTPHNPHWKWEGDTSYFMDFSFLVELHMGEKDAHL